MRNLLTGLLAVASFAVLGRLTRPNPARRSARSLRIHLKPSITRAASTISIR